MSRFIHAVWIAFLCSTSVIAQTAKTSDMPEGVKIEKNLAYGDHERNKLDIYLPGKTDKAMPVVVWIHGGGWEAGSKENPPAPNLLKQGYAVASINYRYSKQSPYPAQIEDCKAAIRYLRGNAAKYNLDKDHIGCMGASAGGHLVALLGTTGDVKELEGKVGSYSKESSRVQAVCDWFGPSDLLKLVPSSAGAVNPVTRLMGGDMVEKKSLAETANPINYITKDNAPFLILHGEKDVLVPVNQSEMLNEALKKGGVESELIVVPGAGHDGRIITTATAKKMSDFFAKHLKGSK